MMCSSLTSERQEEGSDKPAERNEAREAHRLDHGK